MPASPPMNSYNFFVQALNSAAPLSLDNRDQLYETLLHFFLQYCQKARIKEEYRITFVSLNILSNDEHVPEVKHHMKTVVERTRPVYNVRNFSTQMAVEFYIR